MKKEKENKQPVPRFMVYGFQGGRFFGDRYQWRFCINFPCLPLWWLELNLDWYLELAYLMQFVIQTKCYSKVEEINRKMKECSSEAIKLMKELGRLNENKKK